MFLKEFGSMLKIKSTCSKLSDIVGLGKTTKYIGLYTRKIADLLICAHWFHGKMGRNNIA